MITLNGIKKELLNRRPNPNAISFSLEDHLFPQQLSFVRDTAPNKVAVCSRRSGKTTACAADMVNCAIKNQNIVCLYITLSRNNAKKIIWPEIKKLNREYKLGGNENLSELSISFPNGSIIYLSGAKDTTEIEKFRGLAIKLCYIDECQSFRSYIKELIDDVLSPALMDYAGTLCLIGTPGPVPTGYFHDCSVKSNTWSKHGWTFFDNPFLLEKSKLTHQQMLDREVKRRGVALTDPSIQREFFGRWVLDSNSLLVRYDKEKNDYAELPKAKYTYILGVDIGMDDADALAILAWSENSPNIYLVEEKTTKGQDITSLMNQIIELRKKYDISKIVIDTGGLGKKIAEELIRRHQIPLQAADKVRKMENVALLNDFLRTGRFKAKADSKFTQDSYLVEIDRDKTTPEKIKVSDRYHSDIIDAVLYAFKESYAYTYAQPVKRSVYGSKEWAVEEQNKMFEAEVEGIQKEQELAKNLDNPWNFDDYS